MLKGMTISNEEATLPFCESPAIVTGLEGIELYFYDNGILMIPDIANGESDEMLSLSTTQLFFSIWHWRPTVKEDSGARNY
jgi:hypothetical protein